MTGLQVWLHPSSRTVKQLRVSGFKFRVVPEDAIFSADRNLQLETSDPAPLRRPASIVRNRREVLDRTDFNTGRCQRANRRLTSRARPADAHIYRTHPMIARHVGSVGRGLLRSEWRSLARSAEPERARTLPRNHIPRHIGDGHDGVIERRLHMHESVRNVLALFLLERLLLAFFLGSGWAARCCWFCHI